MARAAILPGRDLYSITGKFDPPDVRYDVVVVGAGAAGAEAALEAAKAGQRVLLIDENPLSPGLIGLDVPLYYGGRASSAVQNPGKMMEQVFAAHPLLEEAFEAGVEVRLGVYAWGAFVNGPGLNALPEPVVGLADEEGSWLCGFGRLVVAAGARDLALPFGGWAQPGVMGAQAFHALLRSYNAFSGRRMVILGSGELALKTALLALEHGLEVAALVEVRDQAQGPKALVDLLAAAGTPILVSHAPLEACGGVDGVERLVLASVIDPGAAPVEIACDTICQAIGVVPAIELLSVLGAALSFDPARGGHVPVIDAQGRASVAHVSVIGDCAGVAAGGEGADYALDWTRAQMAVGPKEVIVCQCETVSRAALIGVEPPAYLGPPPKAMRRRGLKTLVADGPINQDQVKRLTRAGMGVCQGRRCRESIALTLAVASGTELSSIPLATYRAPVRPLPLKVLADWAEPAEMGAGWDVWFGIPSQWIPYADIGSEREALHVAALGGDGER